MERVIYGVCGALACPVGKLVRIMMLLLHYIPPGRCGDSVSSGVGSAVLYISAYIEPTVCLVSQEITSIPQYIVIRIVSRGP
jgi:hypothetical protein